MIVCHVAVAWDSSTETALRLPIPLVQWLDSVFAKQIRSASSAIRARLGTSTFHKATRLDAKIVYAIRSGLLKGLVVHAIRAMASALARAGPPASNAIHAGKASGIFGLETRMAVGHVLRGQLQIPSCTLTVATRADIAIPNVCSALDQTQRTVSSVEPTNFKTPVLAPVQLFFTQTLTGFVDRATASVLAAVQAR